MKLSVIIVSYNVKYFLEQAILSVVKASERIDAEVIIIDNHSSDGSIAMLKEKFPQLTVIANDKNTGFSAANNQGIRIAKGEYILLLNPDTVIAEDTLEKTISFMDAHADAGGLGVKMIDGKGNFLPESKRAFPSPEVAFYKAFGLASLFPHSKIFGKYHLGYLSENETHEADVLAGAYMLLRRSVIEKTGLLDETFFMYGEDIDLSYRIVQAGYKNYYFAGTTIIHYKGESTKKGSLNYVRMFYTAMKIFAKKHFSGSRAGFFSALLNIAIYMRAVFALAGRVIKKLALPLLDAVIIFGGMLLIKEYWEYYIKYIEGGKYPGEYVFINIPVYIVIWILSVYFSGGYDRSSNALRIIRGVFWGTIIISAVYGFLPETYRFSRGMIIAGAAFTTFALIIERIILHFIRYKNFRFGQRPEKKILIIGNKTEAERVMQLLNKLHISENILGYVSAGEKTANHENEIGTITQLNDLIEIYRANELIFCSADVPNTEIIQQMLQCGNQIDYKIIPPNSESIIGSNSKNTSGDLYAADVELKITSPGNKRSKRLIDIFFACYLLLTFPAQFMIIRKGGFFRNAFLVLAGKKSWVGYFPAETERLPHIRPGILTPLDGFRQKELDPATIARLNVLYAKDYRPSNDVEIIMKSYRSLGR